MRSARRKVGRLSLAQIQKPKLILFAARGGVSTKILSKRAEMGAPELVAEVFYLNAELFVATSVL